MKLIELLAMYYVLWRGTEAIWNDVPRWYLSERWSRRKHRTVEVPKAPMTATHIPAQQDAPGRTVLTVTPDRLRSMEAQRDNRKAN